MNVLDLFQENINVKKILSFLAEEKDFLVVNASQNIKILLTSLIYTKQNKTIVYVASNIYLATKAYEAFCQILGMEAVNFYAIDEVVATELLATSKEFLKERLFTLTNIINQKPKIIVTHTNALTRPLLNKSVYYDAKIKIKKGMNLDLNEIIRKLTINGYTRSPLTRLVGEYSLRGGVLDIYPLNLSYPIRIDLFDVEVEYIKAFDPISQMTNQDLVEVEVFPLTELIYQDSQKLIQAIKQDYKEYDEHIEEDLIDITNHQNGERLNKYIKYITKDYVGLLSYIEDKIIIYDELSRIEENYEKTQIELAEYLMQKASPISFLYDLGFNSLIDLQTQKIFLLEFRQSLANKYKIEAIKPQAIFNLNSYAVIDYANDLRALVLDLKTNKRLSFILSSKLEVQSFFEEFLKENAIEYTVINKTSLNTKTKVNLLISNNSLSFGFSDSFEVINEASIFKKYRSKKVSYRSASSDLSQITSLEELKIGDYIVHYDYGIAQYLGIKTVELKQIKNDYVMLRFANMEMYIPAQNISLLEKYQGSEGTIPRLTTIGTKDWENKKNKLKKRLLNMASDLIKLQALREEQAGFKYEVDDDIQKDFEADFEYEETQDQIKVIDAIKKDMEEGIIVDRLVCGDVGYGKTEVAMRIAMKTVIGSYQVAYLAPTTILSRQLYLNFVERFEKYGVRVALINRHVDIKTQGEIIKKLALGQIDIIIGTHRLLSKDIKYHKLGLLIIDEEQRFGVIHKEKIKQLKHNINVISLSATPIPRTLHMALIGIRQLSLIETPPLNRYPVQTYVLEYNENIIREAIYREIGRGGQVFYLHNRISDLNRIYRKLTTLVPEAKILLAHGRMDKERLEDSISSFVEGEHDVLLCTTIIETGIDIPNTNTLIVSMADRLGLAQMYQIRGRVGRSDRVSYSYFMFDENKVLTSSGTKRLNAIKEFASLGSGYKIAVRDLAIRGAGDLLGSEQSGFIDSVGLDMYVKLLNDAINEAKGNKIEAEKQNKYNIEISKHVSGDYVSDDEIKIYIHKEIAKIDSKTTKEELLLRLIDRFGSLTDEIKTYIDKEYLDSLLEKIHIEELNETDKEIRASMKSDISAKVKGNNLMNLVNMISRQIRLEYKGRRIHIIIPKKNNEPKWITILISLAEAIIDKPSEFFFIDL